MKKKTNLNKVKYKLNSFSLDLIDNFKPERNLINFNKNYQKDAKIKTLNKKIKNIISTMQQKDKNKLINPLNTSFNPEVTIKEFYDFLAVIYEVKPSCIVGMLNNHKTFNPIADFVKSNKNIFNFIKLENYWDFSYDKSYNTVFIEYKNGFIYNPKLISMVIKNNQDIFKNWNLKNFSKKLQSLKKLFFKNPKKYHTVIGLLLGYKPNEIKKFVKKI